jgi:hypothetical protein
VIKELRDFTEWTSIRKKLDKIETNRELWKGNFVSHCVPPIYPAYCKIFHNIYQDASVSDRTLTWNDSEQRDGDTALNGAFDKLEVEATWVYGGDYDPTTCTRIRWKELAGNLGLVFHPEINVDSFTRNFPGRSWPRHLIGPEEGILHPDTCREIVRSIATSTSDFEVSQECFFHYDCFATNAPQDGDKLYSGKLIEALETYNFPETYGSPAQWWPKDRSWLVCTDWDLTFTLFGGSDDTINTLISNKELECLPVEPTTRIDYKSDHINP